ncbi:MAG: transglutaminase domain-containing protein [Nitrosomonadales bacterium]
MNSRLRYSAHSQLVYHANTNEDPRQLQHALAIPRNFNPRAQQLAAEWRAAAGSDDAVIRTALAYFRQEDFRYTLTPPLLGVNEIDDFLFVTRKGFCEHFASSFVFLMRAAGIPARVVTGYQGGEYNDFGKYYIVRQSDAHAWAEVWLPSRGWVRIDPTAVIAPTRVEIGMAAALSDFDSASLPLMERKQWPWLVNFRFNLDALTNQWNQWVLGYNPERQFALLTRMGMEDITWQRMAFIMLGGLALLTGFFTLLMLRQLMAVKTGRRTALVPEILPQAGPKGHYARRARRPADFAARASQLNPQLAFAIDDITSRYIKMRYGNHFNADALQALRRAVATFTL